MYIARFVSTQTIRVVLLYNVQIVIVGFVESDLFICVAKFQKTRIKNKQKKTTKQQHWTIKTHM